MEEVSTIGLDIAKSVFQVHGVDVAGAVVIRKRVSRAKVLAYFGELPPCLVGIEACPSAHHWGRELQALGHTVRLIPPSYVKAYLKRSKNDANDAAAICEAVTRPSMRFVPIDTVARLNERGRQLRWPHVHFQLMLFLVQSRYLAALRGEIQQFCRGAAEDVGLVVVAERCGGEDMVDGLQLPGIGIVAAQHYLTGADLGHQMADRLG